MSTIYLIRHCESEGNASRRTHAQTDSLVTRKGYAQVEALTERFRRIPVDAVYSSDTFRSIVTAQGIAEEHDCRVKVRIGLRELTTGIWEDESWGNIAQEYPELCKKWMETPWEEETPGATTFQQTADRVIYCLKRICKEVGPEGIAVVVSHSCAIKSTLCALSGLEMDQVLTMGHGENTSVSCIHMDEDGKAIFEYINDASHLPPTLGRAWGGLAGSRINMAVYDMNEAKPEQWAALMRMMKDYSLLEKNKTRSEEEARRETELSKRERDGTVALGILEGRICGYIWFERAEGYPNAGKVRELYVDPELGAGYAEQLLGHAMHVLRYQDYDSLLISKDADSEAERMLERFCFRDSENDWELPLFTPLYRYHVLG